MRQLYLVSATDSERDNSHDRRRFGKLRSGITLARRFNRYEVDFIVGEREFCLIEFNRAIGLAVDAPLPTFPILFCVSLLLNLCLWRWRRHAAGGEEQ